MKTQNERFLIPVLNKNTIQRIKITLEIDRLSRRGILFVHSPAGYGKTTSVALWARGKNVAWLLLDEYSCIPADIYKRMLLALSGKISDGFNDSPLEYTLNVLQNLENWPDALVIDDFHLCTDLAAARTLPLIRSRIPVSTAFIIISRNPPPEILIDHTLKGNVRQLNALEFSDDEIITLFNKNQIQISKYEAETLQQRTHGWAAALAAILLSDKKKLYDLLDSETLYDYLRTYVFDYNGNYHILKKCSVCDILSPALCNAITGQDNAWDIISEFAAKTGLVLRTGNNAYRFHALLKEFLEAELVRDATIDKPLLYKTAAEFYKKEGDILRAINMAAKSNDVVMVEEYLRARNTEYGEFAADIAENASVVFNHVCSEIPAPVIKQSLRLSMDCFMALFNLGRYEESLEFLDAASELLWSGKHTQADIIGTMLLQIIDPRGKNKDILNIVHKVLPLLAEAESGGIASFTMTFNFPLFHRAQVDYADISPELDEFLEGLRKNMIPLSEVFIPLFLLIEAGIRYERGDFAQAEKIALETVQIARNFPPEVQFCAMLIYAEILRVQGKHYTLEPVGTMIAQTKARYLRDNFNAFAANIQLYNGDADTANSWLSQFEVEDTLRFYKKYQYLTTARALMVTGKLPEAETLLLRIIDISLKYGQITDYIEAQTLRSVCLWHMKRQSDSIQAMINSIRKACELELVMPVTKEGGDILPILEKILTRLKRGYDADIIDKSFVNKLFFEAQSMSRYRGVMIRKNKNKPVKLSARQSEILMLLKQNLSYREIGEKLGIKITTVEDHISKLYEKLEVSNARDAVMKIKELGLFKD